MLRRLTLLAALAAAAALPCLAEEQLFFSRTFPGGVPEYFDVTLTRSGHAVYREALDDEFPVEFQVEAETLDRLFQLTSQFDFSEQPKPKLARQLE